MIFTKVTIDPASKALVLELPRNVHNSISARAKDSNVPRTIVHYQHRGRPLKKAKTKSQQYLSPAKEKASISY